MTLPIIIDDVIPKLYQDQLEQFVMFKMPWYYQPDLTFSEELLKELDKKGIFPERRPAFGSPVFDPSKNFNNPSNLLSPVLYSAVSNTPYTLKELLVIRGFMSMPVSADKINRIDKPHIDGYHDHYVCIYYVNDSDGDTVIFNKTLNRTFDDPLTKDMDPTKLPILQTVTPKKGRCVIFNGKFYHASTQPTTGMRCVINFNFI